MGNLPVIVQEEWMVLEDSAIKHYDKSKNFQRKIIKSINFYWGSIDPDFYSKLIEKYDNFISHLMNSGSQDKNSSDKASSLVTQCEFILKDLEKYDPQFKINGPRNIWILKPALLSRGRGIKCFNNLTKILDFVFQKKIPYVCQKYIENPLIIKRKKFDIRQWVLVADWSPLTIWFYEICYARFSADEYDPNNLSNKYFFSINIIRVFCIFF